MLLKITGIFNKRFHILKLILSCGCIVFSVIFLFPLSRVTARLSIFLLQPFAEERSSVSSISTEISTILPESEDKEAQTAPQESTQESGVTEESTVPIRPDSIYSTPADILQLEESYLSEYAPCSAYGTTEEVFFKASGSTDNVDGIYIKNATEEQHPDFKALLAMGPELKIEDKSQPTVLIFHTHTTESYLLSDNGVFYEEYATRSTDNTRNMVRVGNEICRVLEENGIGFIHDTNIYDESYDGAYARSRVTVEKYLEQYPSIQIVLDVHRDAIYYSDTSHCKPTAVIDGKKAAQIMIITGAEEGYITDFPHWEDNLRFALCLQKTAEDMYPGLMKPLYFCQRKYNMDTARCSLLLEMGTDANTLDEAMYSGFLTGRVLVKIINTYCGE